MAGYIKGSKAEITMRKNRMKEYAILKALLYEGYDLDACVIIMDRPTLYLRNLIDQFAEINIEDLI